MKIYSLYIAEKLRNQSLNLFLKYKLNNRKQNRIVRKISKRKIRFYITDTEIFGILKLGDFDEIALGF